MYIARHEHGETLYSEDGGAYLRQSEARGGNLANKGVKLTCRDASRGVGLRMGRVYLPICTTYLPIYHPPNRVPSPLLPSRLSPFRVGNVFKWQWRPTRHQTTRPRMLTPRVACLFLGELRILYYIELLSQPQAKAISFLYITIFRYFRHVL